MILGWLWYGPLFGKKWMAGMKIDPKKMKAAGKSAGKSYAGMIVSSLLTFFVLSKLLSSFAVATLHSTLLFAFWVWLGFVVPIQFGSVLWEGKPSSVFFINVAYNFFNLLVGASLLTLF